MRISKQINIMILVHDSVPKSGCGVVVINLFPSRISMFIFHVKLTLYKLRAIQSRNTQYLLNICFINRDLSFSYKTKINSTTGFIKMCFSTIHLNYLKKLDKLNKRTYFLSIIHKITSVKENAKQKPCSCNADKIWR